ncbi:hypothetical protein OEZ86_002027 [Tetradesmus obliquus]|nr:hypothetical protein OEZ86_002027 [Tetradesmus obliquus]
MVFAAISLSRNTRRVRTGPAVRTKIWRGLSLWPTISQNWLAAQMYSSTASRKDLEALKELRVIQCSRRCSWRV